LYSETCAASHDRNQFIDIKVEVADTKVEEVTDVNLRGSQMYRMRRILCKLHFQQ
jgi:hypothetical protein